MTYVINEAVYCYQVDADLVVGAGDVLTLVDVVLALEAVEARKAFAVEVVARVSLHLLHVTLAAVLAGLLGARVVWGVAGWPHECRGARAGEVVDLETDEMKL